MDQEDAEMLAIWNGILPANELLKVCKRPLSPDDRSRSRSNTQKRRGPRQEDRGAERDVPELLNLIARLSLRHEDTLAVLLQQNQFILHRKGGQGSLLPLMMAKSKSWHAETPKTTSLRSCLASLMMDTLTERVTKLLTAQKGDEMYLAGMARNMLTEQGTCPFLSWHPQQKRLIQSKDKPLEASELLKILEEIQQHLKDQSSVLRFHSMRKLAPDSELKADAVYPWMLTVSPALHASMARISYHSAWQLVSVDLKRQTAARSPLAKQVATSLAKRDRWGFASTSHIFTAG